MDKVSDALVEALKQGMTEPAEIRLFRSGKLSGLFQSRTSVNGDAAKKALEEGMLEVVRTETRGRSTVQWVHITQTGIDFVLNYESPVRVLEELRRTLQTSKDGFPVWIAELKRILGAIDQRVTDEIENMSRRIDGLQLRVESALQRIEETTPKIPASTSASIPWAQDALTYMDLRREGGVESECPLPELFAALRQQKQELSILDFHAGLRRLHDRGVLRLLPFGASDEIPEPEYALLEGNDVYYYVA